MIDQKKLRIAVIMGLGNPGHAYRNNRHNVGFQLLDMIGERYGAVWNSKGDSLVATINIVDVTVLLVKPQTFMNNSGAVIGQLFNSKNFDSTSLLVIHDELEVPFGQIKLKSGGSHGGHNGLRSLVDVVGKEFIRLRFGISRPASKLEVPSYVLSNFNASEQMQLGHLFEKSIGLIESLFK